MFAVDVNEQQILYHMPCLIRAYDIYLSIRQVFADDVTNVCDMIYQRVMPLTL